MKLPSNNATHLKIPLSQIKETGNVRQKYDANGIAELAESIKNNGLLNPLTVKPGQADKNGNKTYELIAGHRRLRAHQLLCENGDDFSMVECCVRPGKKIVLQMIENIQRQDITPREKEEAVKAMLAEGYTQSDIARELSKPIAWVSDIVAGTRVREVADENDIDTDGIATKTLSQLRSIPESELTDCLTQLVMRGGTMKAATDILHEWKAAQDSSHSELDSESTTNESSSEDESTIEPHEMTESEWEDEVRRYDNAFAEAMGRKTPEQLADEALAPQSKTEPKPPKKPDSFNWYIKNTSAMENAMLVLPAQMKKMPLDTKICVQAGSKVAEISSVIYEPNENRLTFRCLEDFGIR